VQTPSYTEKSLCWFYAHTLWISGNFELGLGFLGVEDWIPYWFLWTSNQSIMILGIAIPLYLTYPDSCIKDSNFSKSWTGWIHSVEFTFCRVSVLILSVQRF
jgi:hypothetical protein